jgi:sirohydrochlorin ferrochelatase
MTAPEVNSQSLHELGSNYSVRNNDWAEFSRKKGAILVVGHGTRNPQGAAQLRDLVAQMQAKLPMATVRGSFLELAEPSIEQSINDLASLGTQSILVVPVLLFSAAHAKQDIPDAVKQASAPVGIEIIGQTESLGTHPSVLELSGTRFQEIQDLQNARCCPAGSCARVRCLSNQCESQGVPLGRIGLAMVGRGTSDQAALDHMRRLTSMHIVNIGLDTYATGFFAGGTPNVDGLLDQASQWDCDTVVVQPHLLFEGELMDQLRSKVLSRQQMHPTKRWLIARSLGADPLLANVFLDLAYEQLPKNEPKKA